MAGPAVLDSVKDLAKAAAGQRVGIGAEMLTDGLF
jgi:hypothetical protein